jgi:hypothetical protein
LAAGAREGAGGGDARELPRSSSMRSGIPRRSTIT